MTCKFILREGDIALCKFAMLFRFVEALMQNSISIY